jgi:hypothetical protein
MVNDLPSKRTDDEGHFHLAAAVSDRQLRLPQWPGGEDKGKEELLDGKIHSLGV